ncbi:uncharacterized protein LOC124537859 [Vanessa cardui]|nr:uncharacterized protein LOC124537859 [Vanessa cardui]
MAFTDLAETLITAWLDDFSGWLKKQVFLYFDQLSKPADATAEKKLRKFDIDETCQIVSKSIPETYLFSEKTVSDSVRLVVSSFSHKEVNKDVIFRSLDIFAVHFKKSAGLRNPSFDNN